jgi:hypothetical protein
MRREWRKARGLAILILLMLLVELSIVSFSASAGLITTVSVDMDDLVEVDVSPGSDGTAAIKGVVTCQTANPAPCIVNLSPTSSVGSATIDKPSIVFQGGGIQSREFEVVIVVPLFSDASESESCTVRGTWQQGGTSGQVESVTTQIIILPFYRMTIFSEQPVQEVRSGEGKKFGMRIQNAGNCDDTYTLRIVNLEELEAKGIKIDCINEISLQTLQPHIFDIDVQTSSDTPTQSHRILLKVTSQCSEMDSDGLYEEEYQMFIKVVTFKIGCGMIQALQYTGIAAALIVTGVFVYIKKFKKHPVLKDVE